MPLLRRFLDSFLSTKDKRSFLEHNVLPKFPNSSVAELYSILLHLHHFNEAQKNPVPGNNGDFNKKMRTRIILSQPGEEDRSPQQRREQAAAEALLEEFAWEFARRFPDSRQQEKEQIDFIRINVIRYLQVYVVITERDEAKPSTTLCGDIEAIRRVHMHFLEYRRQILLRSNSTKKESPPQPSTLTTPMDETRFDTHDQGRHEPISPISPPTITVPPSPISSGVVVANNNFEKQSSIHSSSGDSGFDRHPRGSSHHRFKKRPSPTPTAKEADITLEIFASTKRSRRNSNDISLSVCRGSPTSSSRWRGKDSCLMEERKDLFRAMERKIAVLEQRNDSQAETITNLRFELSRARREMTRLHDNDQEKSDLLEELSVLRRMKQLQTEVISEIQEENDRLRRGPARGTDIDDITRMLRRR